MKKVLKLIILLFVCTVGITTVLGDPKPDKGGNDNESAGGNGGYNHHAVGSSLRSSSHAGIRISLITASGEVLAHSDYVNNGIYTSDLYYENNPSAENPAFKTCTSKEMLNRVTYETSSKQVEYDYSNCELKSKVEHINVLEKLLSDCSFDGVDFEGKLSQWNLGGLLDPIFEKLNNDSSYRDKFVKFLEGLGLSEEMLQTLYDKKSGVYDVFLVYEPTAIILVQINDIKWNQTGNREYRHIYGTTYELANELYKYPGGTAAKNCETSWNKGFCDVANAVRNLGCSSYLTGSLESQMKGFSTVNGIKFTKDLYFGKIKINHNLGNICSNHDHTNLPRTMLNGDLGIGMGVAWIGGYISQTTCQDVEREFPNLKSGLESYYKQGGLNKIYASHPSELTLSSSKKVSMKWYVNECTCYGVYDAYNTYMKNDYESKKIKDYRIIPLYEVSSNVIKNKFAAGVFSGYNGVMQNIFQNNELNYTPWDYQKYEKLNCGSKEYNKCDAFESWYEENKTAHDPSLDNLKNHTEEWIVQNYGTRLTKMIDKYNTIYYPVLGFKWSLNEEKEIGNKVGKEVRAYIKDCLNATETNCDTIINFYNKNGIDLTKYSKTKIEKFNFSAYNKQYGVNIEASDFLAACYEDKDRINCTPSYNVGNCTNSEKIYYKDSSQGSITEDYWDNCVFNDYGDYDIDVHKTDVTYFDENLSSNYCETYCIEAVNASLPSEGINVEAGRYFVWGQAIVKGSRTCKTKSIDYNKFKTDLEKNNQSLINAYYDWQYEIAKKDAIDNASVEKQSRSCPIYDTITLMSTNHYKKDGTFDKCQGDCDKPAPSGYTCGEAKETITRHENGRVKTRTYITECKKVSGYENKYTTNKVSGTITLPNGTKRAYTYDSQSWCGNDKPTTNVVTKKTAYDKANNKVTSTINGMKSCYEWNENTIYNVNPLINLDYTDGINYKYNGSLSGTTEYTVTDSNSSCTIDYVYKTTCNNKVCKQVKVEMKKCSVVEMTREATTSYRLPDNLYRYVLKDGNLSVSYKPTGYRYVDIGYSNLPVSYSIKNGVHGSGIDSAKLNLSYSNLGHTANVITLDSILKNTTEEARNDYGKWNCKFSTYGIKEVIDVQYRLIDLINPFPDINANNRNTGLNWCSTEGNCKHNNDTVLTYINNNRGVEDYDLYTIEPMYTFILTPSDILEIRKYNSKNSYTSYTGYYNGKSYEYKCNTMHDTSCISDYFTHLLEITDAYDNPGVCTANKYRTYTDFNNFEACRYLKD